MQKGMGSKGVHRRTQRRFPQPFDVYAVQPTGNETKHVVKVRGVEYVTFTTPVVGFAIQCKRYQTK